MATEKYANQAETTLASSYTSGGASISVVSASGFPTAGVFRVRLGNPGKTIYRVDSVSGTTFTGGAEFNDANAASAVTVKIVASRQVAERWIQSPTVPELRGVAGVSAADFYGPLWKFGDPTVPSWSWVNQGGAAVVEADGIVYLTVPSSTTSVRGRVIAAPGTPYTITLGLMERVRSGGSQYGGLMFRESGTSKIYLYYTLSSDVLQAVKFTNETTFSAVGAVNTSLVYTPTLHWLRVTDDGTNLKFFQSADKRNWLEYGSEGRTIFMAGGPNQVGIFGNVDGNVGDCAFSFVSWEQS